METRRSRPARLARNASPPRRQAGAPDPLRTEDGQTLATSAYRRLRDDILTGVLPPNSKLLMRDLQDRYQLSVAPLREALSRLHAEELVCSSDHRGFWVSPISIQEIRELTHMRMLLEESALRDSIAGGGGDWELEVVTAFRRLEHLTQRGAQFAAATLPEFDVAHDAFHRALIAAGSSRLLLRLRASLTQTVRRYRTFALIDASARDHLGEHRGIFEATIERDAETAVRRLSEHYELTTRIIVSKFEEAAP
ncbi:MAG: GntR family transcriptional regulator [Xanthobacteraceae bacterium]|nr:GntR family transcriptional regulator [Xanthobacteraceae bacterium]